MWDTIKFCITSVMKNTMGGICFTMEGKWVIMGLCGKLRQCIWVTMSVCVTTLVLLLLLQPLILSPSLDEDPKTNWF